MHSAPSKRASLLASLDRHLANSSAILAASVAGIATVAVSAPAEAAIVYNNNAGAGWNVPSTTAGIYINLATGVFGTTPASAPGWDLNPWGSTSNNFWANNAASPNDGVIGNFTGGSSTTLVDNVPTGTVVDGSWTYSRSSSSETTGATAMQLNSSNNYIGFRFLNEGTGQINFGWAHFQLGGLGTQPRNLIEYAYENTGAPINVGDTGVPEPTSLAMLAIGAVGLLKRRSR